MSKLFRHNRRIFFAIMATSFLQMAQFAFTPGIAKIQSEVFTQISLSAVQTIIMLPSLLSMLFSLFSVYVISKGWISKKASVVIGISLLVVTGITAIFLHKQIWHLILFSVLIGSGMGFYISTTSSIMFDNFNEAQRRITVGVQTSVINLGGIVISAAGGYLASLIWYGGYVLLLIALPVVIICILMIPNDKRSRKTVQEPAAKSGKGKIPLDVYYYGFITFVFLLGFTVCGTNISNHVKEAGLGNTATAGIITAAHMAGGVFAGLIFNRLSAKLKDYMIPLAFIVVFIGYMIISLGYASLAANLIGVFIAGTAISIIIPQCLFSVSNHVNKSNSAAATAIVNCIFPGMGGFLSPIVFTNLTTALGGASTVYRFKFVGIVYLALGLILVLTTRYRNRENSVVSAAAQAAK